MVKFNFLDITTTNRVYRQVIEVANRRNIKCQSKRSKTMKILVNLFLSCVILAACTFIAARENDNDDAYEGPSGKRYEYDLSDPVDQIMYEVDPAAKIRDSVDPDPRRDLDRDLGRPGGGALDDDPYWRDD